MKKNIGLNSIFLVVIFILSFALRIYSINWDQGNHLHPDERMLVMVADKISWPKSGEILSPQSSLNPNFFAYGSFPIYLLKSVSVLLTPINPSFATYAQINLVGRGLSALFDSFTVILIYKITTLLFYSKKKAVLASIIYALSVLPIQLSHFFAVDTILTFFIFFTLYHLIQLYNHFNLKNAFWVGTGFGLALSTKISAAVLIFSLGLGLIISLLLTLKKEIFGEKISFFMKVAKYLIKIFEIKFWTFAKRKKVKKIILYFSFILLTSFITFAITQPFAILDFPNFWKQINEQRLMTRDAFVFPYTLQYVNTTPYIYQIKNIILWGMGPAFGLVAFLGLVYTITQLIKGLLVPGNEKSEGAQIIVYSFFLIYFLVVGGFSVKFMRYYLPLYPILSIFAAHAIFSLKSKILFKILLFTSLIVHSLSLLAFLNIYSTPNTRVLATEWINKNITKGSTILREHWDDGLPLGYNDNLTLLDLPLYESDNDLHKWEKIEKMLQVGDYIIIASNRLYKPLQRLTDCDKLPIGKCYNKTSQYYQQLFSGSLGYKKVAEFENYPRIFNWVINDDSADESFSVYDHPKVIIYKKIIE